MDELARIDAAGWADPSVGVLRWYGIVAEGEATVAGHRMKGEGRPALTRQAAGPPLSDEITLVNRYAGQVDG